MIEILIMIGMTHGVPKTIESLLGVLIWESFMFLSLLQNTFRIHQNWRLSFKKIKCNKYVFTFSQGKK